jgi:hypothetical protein
MRKFALQYVLLFMSLGAMYSSLAYLRAYAPVDYIAQLATLLVLFSWITPIESSLGNLVFRIAYSPREKTAFPEELPLYVRAILFGIFFGIIFRIYPAGGYEPSILISLLVCIFFSMRLIENILKMSLVSVSQGIHAQGMVNFITFSKWTLCLFVFILGAKSFTFFILCNIALGFLSIFFLYRKKKYTFINFTEKINKFNEKKLTFRDDLVSILSVSLGVLGFQIDKILVGSLSNPGNYGQYVMLCTMVFIGPYLMSPIFSIYQKKIISSKIGDVSSKAMDVSIIRFPALIISVATLLTLKIFDNYFLHTPETIFTKQLGFIAVASYLNCLAHIYYLKYQIYSNFYSILKQNFCCVIFAIIAATIIVLCDSELYSLVIVFAALGQCIYGAINEYKVKNEKINYKEYLIILNCVPYFLIYTFNPNINSLIILTFITLFSGLLMEAWALGMNFRQYIYEAKICLTQ